MSPRGDARVLVLAALAGCFSPQPPAGVPCAPEGSAERCPAGQFCVMQGGLEICDVVEVPDDASDTGDASGVLDRDSDGFADEADNCIEDANPDQSDEDGDGVGDVCDPCPPFDDNTDGDGDGVGDACDPNPGVTGDQLVLFEGFTGDLPATWTIAGLVTTDGGDALALGTETASAILTIPSPPGMRVEIRASTTLDALTATGLNLGAIGLVDRLQAATDRAVVCQLSGLADRTQEQLRIFDAAAMTVVNTAPHPFTPGLKTELRLRRNGPAYACRATNPSLEIAGNAAFAPGSPRIGLRARGAIARYHWVMVVTSP